MTVLAEFQLTGSNPSIVGGTGTTAKYFPRVLGSSIGVTPSTPSATNATGQLLVPASDTLHGRLFKIKAAGTVLPFTGNAGYTIDIVGNYGPINSPNYFTLMTVFNNAVATSPFNWWMEGTVVGTNIGQAFPGPGYLTGSYWGVLSNTLIPLISIFSQGQNLNFTTGSTNSGMQGAVFGIAARVTFQTSLAQNSASLYQLQVVAD